MKLRWAAFSFLALLSVACAREDNQAAVHQTMMAVINSVTPPDAESLVCAPMAINAFGVKLSCQFDSGNLDSNYFVWASRTLKPRFQTREVSDRQLIAGRYPEGEEQILTLTANRKEDGFMINIVYQIHGD